MQRGLRQVVGARPHAHQCGYLFPIEPQFLVVPFVSGEDEQTGERLLYPLLLARVDGQQSQRGDQFPQMSLRGGDHHDVTSAIENT